jgi:hypothetical protein
MLAIVHLVALGFMSQVILGSLFQLLPVLAGSNISRTSRFSIAIWLLLNCGTLVMASGFIWVNFHIVAIGAALLSFCLIPFSALTIITLYRQDTKSTTLTGILLALLALIGVVFYGDFLIMQLSGWLHNPDIIHHVNRHATLALVGWLGFLVISVSYQIHPLFFVSEEYPDLYKKTAVPIAIICLASYMLLNEPWLLSPIAFLGIVFSLLLIQRLWNRKRKRLDPIIILNYLTATAMFTAAALHLSSVNGFYITMTLIYGIGVIMPAATLLKIIPFLCWMHLQEERVKKQYFNVPIPNMKRFIGDFPPLLLATQLILITPALIMHRQEKWLTGATTGTQVIAVSLTLIYLISGALFRYRKALESFGPRG